MLEFVKTLEEARMLRDEKNALVLSYTDCCERMYLILLCLELMRYYPKYKDFVKAYAKKSTNKNDYNIFRMFSTDLHNFIYFVTGDEKTIAKLKDPSAAKKIRSRTTLPVMAVNRYLSQLANDSKPTSVSQFFLKIESALHITNSNYKSIRRLVTNLKDVTNIERERFATKLVFAVRAKLRSSDIIEKFEKFIADKSLELNKAVDNEPTISVPDVGSTPRDIQFYRYLVGQNNLMMAKKFLDVAKTGAAVPSQFVKGYFPVVKMVDDIVKAGPSYVMNLRALHQRAQKHLK